MLSKCQIHDEGLQDHSNTRSILRSPSQASHSAEHQHAQQHEHMQQASADSQPSMSGSRAPLSRQTSFHSCRTQQSQQQQHVHRQQWPADHHPSVTGGRSLSRTVSQASHQCGERRHPAHHQLSADRWSDMTDVRPGSLAGSQTSQYSSWQTQRHQASQGMTASIPESTAYMPPKQLHGTPGPGAYDHPSCFLPAYQYKDASYYALASQVGASIKGRNWPAPDTSSGCSPGPQAYAPVLEADSARRTAPKAVFSSVSRDNLDKLHLGSEELNRSTSRTPSPGPAAYRVGRGRSPGRQSPGPPAGPRATFAPSRLSPQHLTAAMTVISRKCRRGPGNRSPCNRSPCSGIPARYPADSLSTAISVNLRDISGMYRQQPFRPASCADFADADAAALTKRRSSGLNNGTRFDTPDPGAGAAEPQADATEVPGKQKLRSKSAGAKAFSSNDCQVSGLGGHAWSFGPPGGLAVGTRRRRSQEANVYISSRHTAVDPGKAAHGVPGAGAYDVANRLQVLSTHKVEGKAPFGTAERPTTSKAKMYLSAELVKFDSSLACSPGPGTAAADALGTISAAAGGTVHSTRIGPRFGSPIRILNANQAHTKQEADKLLRAGRDFPGPGAYDVVASALAGTVLGDRRTAHFGTGDRGLARDSPGASAPSPGTYMPDTGKLSTHKCSPSYSLGSAVTWGGTHINKVTPGVGTYSIDLADRLCLPNGGAVTIKGKPSDATGSCSCSPGPAAYVPARGMGYEAGMYWRLRWGNKYAYCQYGIQGHKRPLHRGVHEEADVQPPAVRELQQVAGQSDAYGCSAYQLDLTEGIKWKPAGEATGSEASSFRSIDVIDRVRFPADPNSHRSASSVFSLGTS